MQEKCCKEKDGTKTSKLEGQEKIKTYHEIDPEEATTAVRVLKNDPNFKFYIKMREAEREEVIRNLQSQACIDNTSRHFMMTGKLESIDEELDRLH